jgi:hypothetical protein
VSGDTLGRLLILLIIILVGVIPMAWLKFRANREVEEDPKVSAAEMKSLLNRINREATDYPDRQSY